MVQKNVGTINALIRITAGLTAVSYGTACLVKKPHREMNSLLIVLGAMKVAEGIVRYCPVTDMIDNTDMFENVKQNLTQGKQSADQYEI
ncbi:YgaP family membrane protein [Salinibacillus xinjiangensis]|uniref:YgaP family membrane protein n=1 Tax=Salinibacillus xinjiangensis TaxID=1229268 RepID=UPI00129BC18C|nr:DUF2892 domain-containing protein [Salinibacillus xinjiangensis]